jgi:hypothetical protein
MAGKTFKATMKYNRELLTKGIIEQAEFNRRTNMIAHQCKRKQAPLFAPRMVRVK